jgi:cytochrome c2
MFKPAALAFAFALTAFLTAGQMPTPAHAAAAVTAGKKVFKKNCKTCHKVKADKHNIGPSLHGVFGRTSGTAKGFKKYSKAMKAAKIEWTDETITAYLRDPKGYIPGVRIQFAGLKDDGQLADLLAYLHSKQ